MNIAVIYALDNSDGTTMTTQAILTRLHEALGTKNNYQLCKELKFSSGAIDGWIRRNSTPYEACFRTFQKTGYSMEWMLTGVEPKLSGSVQQQHQAKLSTHPANIDPEILKCCLEQGIDEAQKFGLLKVESVDQETAYRLTYQRVLFALQNWPVDDSLEDEPEKGASVKDALVKDAPVKNDSTKKAEQNNNQQAL